MSMKYNVQLPIEYVAQFPWAPTEKTLAIYPKQAYVNELKSWCKEVVGTNGWNYYGQYRKIPYQFRFKRGEDLLAFKLRFGL